MKHFNKAILGIASFISLSLLVSTKAYGGTSVYVGRDISATDTTIIAGSAYDAPGARTVIDVRQKENSDEPKSVTSNDGYEYYLPLETFQYQFIQNMDEHNVNAAINEYAVSVSVDKGEVVGETLLEEDPYVESGIGRDTLVKTVLASSKNANDSISLIADIIDENGSKEGMKLLVADQKDAWYMEVYTGHKYAAIKLPRDVVATIGDEYVLPWINVSDYELVLSPNEDKLPDRNAFNRLSNNKVITKPQELVDFSDVKELVCNYDNASSAHIIQIVSNAPAKIADVMWVNLEGTYYTPFVPVSNAASIINEAYSKEVSLDEYNESNASYTFARLNAISKKDSEDIGKEVERCISLSEESEIECIIPFISTYYAEVYDESPQEAKEALEAQCNRFASDLYGYGINIYENAIDYMVMGEQYYDADDTEAFEEENVIDSPYGFQIGLQLDQYAELKGWEYRANEDTILIKTGKENFIIEYNEEDETDSRLIVAPIESVDEENVDATEALSSGSSSEINVDIDVELGLPEEIKEEIVKIRTIITDKINEFFENQSEKVPSKGYTKDELLEQVSVIKEETMNLVEESFADYEGEIPTEIFGNEQIAKQAMVGFALIDIEATDLVEEYFDKVTESIEENLTKTELTQEEVQNIYNGINEDAVDIVNKMLNENVDQVLLNKFDENAVEDFLSNTGNAVINTVESLTGVDVTEITVDDVIDVLEDIDPETKDLVGEFFGMDVDEAIIAYRESEALEKAANTEEVNLDAEDEAAEDVEEVQEEEQASLEEIAEEEEETETETEVESDETQEEVIEDKDGLTEDELVKVSEMASAGEVYRICVNKIDGKFIVSTKLLEFLSDFSR